jgi:hypothetical protein
MKCVLLFLAVFATSAFATGFDLGGDKTYNTANQTSLQAVGVDVSNRITNDTRSAASSFAAGGVGVGGDARAYGGAGGSAVSGGGQGGIGYSASGGSTSNVDFNITSPKNTPAVFSGNVYPTAPCSGSTTIGGAGVGFGVSIGTSWTDSDCSIRETARSFHQMGLGADAIRVLCTSPYAANAPSCAAEVEARKVKE